MDTVDRGFHRLGVATGILGVPAFLAWFGSEGGFPYLFAGDSKHLIGVAVGIGLSWAVPYLLVRMIGWIVQGFMH